MFIMVYTDNATLLIWRALQIDPDTWKKKNSQARFVQYEGRKKKKGWRSSVKVQEWTEVQSLQDERNDDLSVKQHFFTAAVETAQEKI